MIQDISFDVTLGSAIWQTAQKWCGYDIAKRCEAAVDRFVQQKQPWRLPQALKETLDKSKRIICLSDLHIGAGTQTEPDGKTAWSARDVCSQGRTEAFERFLERYTSAADTTLVYLGDIFECWKFDDSRILAQRQALLDKMARGAWVYVPGNHDRCFGNGLKMRNAISSHPFFDRISHQFVLKIGGKNILFLHGHEFDPYNQGEDPPVGQAATIAEAQVEDTVGAPVMKGDDTVIISRLQNILSRMTAISQKMFSPLSWLAAKIKNPFAGTKYSPSQDSSLLAQHLRSAWLLKSRLKGTDNEFDDMVAGHTHKPGDRFWYHNDGSWAEMAPLTFLEIVKGEDGEPSFHYYEWKDDHPSPMADPILKV